MNATLNGIKLAYQLDGPKDRPAVVLVHGFPFSRATWKGQVAALKKDFRVLSYDLRGQGQSSLGPAPQPLEAYVDDLIALLEHLKLVRVGLLGLSMGGYIALRAIQRHPERFWALALCDTKSDPDTDEGKLGRAAGIKALRTKGVKAFAEGMLPKLLVDPKSAAGKGLLKVMLQNKVPGMANALAAMQGRTDTGPALAALTVPALIVVGEKDAITPVAAAEAMKQKCPQAELVVLPNAGHVSNLEAPEAFNAALLRHFKAAAPAA
jgi:pimeloyl-ACP methyl ester carboxylesterase